MRKVEVRISPDGSKVAIETTGFQGASCLEATKELEKRFRVTKDEATAEMEAPESVGLEALS